MADDRRCLHCDETKASIRANGIMVCGIMEGYEVQELVEEFPHHRWADWNDRELGRIGVRKDAFRRHRRTRLVDMQWIACDDTVRGHIPAKAEDVHVMASYVGQCILCGADRRYDPMPTPPSGYAACRTYPPGDSTVQTTHLVALDEKGSNGGRPTVCGLTRFDRFEEGRPIPGTADLPGWSMGGGVVGPGITQIRCPDCWRRAPIIERNTRV